MLFATSATTSHGFDLRVTGRDAVNTLAAREQRTVIAQGKALTALERKVQAATSEAAKTDSRVAQAANQAAAVADDAGLEPVTGPAVTVTLNDAPSLPGKEPSATTQPAKGEQPSFASGDIGTTSDEQLSEAADVLRGLALVNGRTAAR